MASVEPAPVFTSTALPANLSREQIKAILDVSVSLADRNRDLLLSFYLLIYSMFYRE